MRTWKKNLYHWNERLMIPSEERKHGAISFLIKVQMATQYLMLEIMKGTDLALFFEQTGHFFHMFYVSFHISIMITIWLYESSSRMTHLAINWYSFGWKTEAITKLLWTNKWSTFSSFVLHIAPSKYGSFNRIPHRIWR